MPNDRDIDECDDCGRIDYRINLIWIADKERMLCEDCFFFHVAPFSTQNEG